MTDVLKPLPPFTWRGKRVPVTSREVSFRHETVDHPLAFRDGELVEQTGAKNWTFRYTIPMREDIQVEPYQNLFVNQLIDFVASVRDRSPGLLMDPVYGEFRCVPATFSDATDVIRRDGTDLTIEFIHSPKLEDLDEFGESAGADTVSGAAQDAKRLDEEVALADWQQEEPPEPSADPLSAIDGLGRQVEAIGNQVSAKFDDAAFRLEKIEETVDRLTDPDLWPIKRSSRRLRNTVLRLKEKHDNPGRRIRSFTQSFAKTISGVAADFGMTVQELIQLNPNLAENPVVPPNTVVFYFAEELAA